MTITHLYVDVGDTLLEPIRYDPKAGLANLRPHAVGVHAETPESFPTEELLARTRELDRQIEPRAEAGMLEHQQLQFQRILFDSFGVRFNISELEREWLYWEGALGFRPEPGVHDALKGIVESGIRLGVISNTAATSEVIRRELNRHDLAEFFDLGIETSADYGIRKPDPVLFEAVLGKHGVDRRSAAYIGNSYYHDVLGAANAGLQVIWYNRRGHPRTVTAPEPLNAAEPDLEVSGWPEVREAISTVDDESA